VIGYFPVSAGIFEGAILEADGPDFTTFLFDSKSCPIAIEKFNVPAVIERDDSQVGAGTGIKNMA